MMKIATMNYGAPLKTCKDCDYYLPLGDGKTGRGEPTKVGNCFRYPPTVLPDDKGSSYPIVGANERQCGEFLPKVKRKATR